MQPNVIAEMGHAGVKSHKWEYLRKADGKFSMEELRVVDLLLTIGMIG